MNAKKTIVRTTQEPIDERAETIISEPPPASKTKLRSDHQESSKAESEHVQATVTTTVGNIMLGCATLGIAIGTSFAGVTALANRGCTSTEDKASTQVPAPSSQTSLESKSESSQVVHQMPAKKEGEIFREILMVKPWQLMHNGHLFNAPEANYVIIATETNNEQDQKNITYPQNSFKPITSFPLEDPDHPHVTIHIFTRCQKGQTPQAVIENTKAVLSVYYEPPGNKVLSQYTAKVGLCPHSNERNHRLEPHELESIIKRSILQVDLSPITHLKRNNGFIHMRAVAAGIKVRPNQPRD